MESWGENRGMYKKDLGRESEREREREREMHCFGKVGIYMLYIRKAVT